MNAFVDGGRAPCHFAADYGQLEVLRFLVTQKGADVNAKDKHGISVILAAIWEGHTDCVKFLIQNVSKLIMFENYLSLESSISITLSFI